MKGESVVERQTGEELEKGNKRRYRSDVVRIQQGQTIKYS